MTASAQTNWTMLQRRVFGLIELVVSEVGGTEKLTSTFFWLTIHFLLHDLLFVMDWSCLHIEKSVHCFPPLFSVFWCQWLLCLFGNLAADHDFATNCFRHERLWSNRALERCPPFFQLWVNWLALFFFPSCSRVTISGNLLFIVTILGNPLRRKPFRHDWCVERSFKYLLQGKKTTFHHNTLTWSIYNKALVFTLWIYKRFDHGFCFVNIPFPFNSLTPLPPVPGLFYHLRGREQSPAHRDGGDITPHRPRQPCACLP